MVQAPDDDDEAAASKLISRHTVEPHYDLRTAAERFFPRGPVTARSLRTEIRKGRLKSARIAGKIVVSEAAIQEMLTRCQDTRRVPASCSGAARRDCPSGSSSTTDRRSARDAALATLTALRQRSRRGVLARWNRRCDHQKIAHECRRQFG